MEQGQTSVYAYLGLNAFNYQCQSIAKPPNLAIFLIFFDDITLIYII